jgi:hypothetical protein
MDNIIENIGRYFLMPAMMLIAVALVVALPFGIYHEMTAETVSLKKLEWSCTKQGTRRSGKIIVTECVEWQRNA